MSSRTLCTSLLMAFLLVAGIGAATFYWRDSTAVIGSGGTIPLRSGPDGEMLSRLESYVRSTGAEQPVSEAAARELLPDVNTMIERLAARLEAAPEDSKGWRMLGWSYFNTGRYEQAATAYAKAVKLDPNSAELKLSYEEAKAKASETPRPCKPGLAVVRTNTSQNTGPKRCHQREQDAAIRAMVDGLAASPGKCLRETSKAGLALCALALCLARERSRQQRSARRSRSSRTTRQHRAGLRPRRLSSA